MNRVIALAGLASICGVAVWAQPAAAPAFEVASVKASPPMGSGPIRMGISGGPGSPDPGRISCFNTGLKDLFIRAYGIKQYQFSGPDWMAQTRFDIVASVPHGTTKEEVMVMWQTLLADRFKIGFHRESKEMPVYALVVAKGGPKMEEAADPPPQTDGGRGAGTPVSFGGGGGGGSSAPQMAVGVMRATQVAGFAQGGPSRMSMSKITMAAFADMITRNVDRPVIDATELTASYKIKLEWQPDDSARPSVSSEGGAGAPEMSVAQNIFTALQQQLGLKLEQRKAPVEYFVIDRAEKSPIEN